MSALPFHSRILATKRINNHDEVLFGLVCPRGRCFRCVIHRHRVLICDRILTCLLTSAIEILQPDDTSQWDFSSKNTITWKNVSTDPQTFNVVLVNGAATPPSTTVIAQGVNTADDQYSFSNIAAAPGNKYSIEFVGTAAQSSGILAQSKQFNVTKSGGVYCGCALSAAKRNRP